MYFKEGGRPKVRGSGFISSVGPCWRCDVQGDAPHRESQNKKVEGYPVRLSSPLNVESTVS